MSESNTAITTPSETCPAPLSTALVRGLATTADELDLRKHEGLLTPRAFSSPQQELSSLLNGSAAFDLGYRSRIKITGEDQVRWLNGMVTNSIQGLAEHEGNYNFILNAQGRIQGDGYIYRSTDHLVLDTTRSQTQRLFEHLDHYIIMDDVELRCLDDETTTIGIAGPGSAQLLLSLGLPAQSPASLNFLDGQLNGMAVKLVRAYSVAAPRFELWFHPQHAFSVWQTLLAAGAAPAGIGAVESLRVLEGIPRYGVDFTDRHLAQETSQTRALNFSKGCYLGQEIVERIRSRAQVHRYLRHFELTDAMPQLPADLRVAGEEKPAGQLTSAAEVAQPAGPRRFAIGFARTEALERKAPLEYAGGTALVLDSPPSIVRAG